MYNLIKYLILTILLSITAYTRNWFDLFHSTVCFIMLVLVMFGMRIVHRIRQIEDVVIDEQEDILPSISRTAAIAVVQSLILAVILVGGMHLAEKTPLYFGFVDRDLPNLKSKIDALENAGNFDAAAKLIKVRITKPLSLTTKQTLVQRFYNDTIQNGKNCIARGDLYTSWRSFKEAVETAHQYQLNDELARMLMAQSDEMMKFETRLEQLSQDEKWYEVMVAVNERLENNKDDQIFSSYIVKALINLGSEENIPLAKRVEYLHEAIAKASKYGLEIPTIHIEAAIVEKELVRRQLFEKQLDDLRVNKKYKEAVDLLTQALGGHCLGQWKDSLTKWLYTTYLGWAEFIPDQEGKAHKYEQAVAIAKEAGLDYSLANEHLNTIRTEIENATIVLGMQNRLNKFEEKNRQSQPIQLPNGIKAGISKISNVSFPIITVDIWVNDAQDQPFTTLQNKDFQVNFANTQVHHALASMNNIGSESFLQVVLAIDRSSSMEGEAILEARKGAKQFIESLPENSKVQVLTFNNKVNVVCPFTTDIAEVARTIDNITTSGGTALHMAIQNAIDALITLPNNFDKWRYVVMLTDGKNTIGNVKIPELLNRCKEQNIRITAIGLKTASLNESFLKYVTSATDGEFLVADKVELLTTKFAEAAKNIRQKRYRLALTIPETRTAGELDITVGQGPYAVTIRKLVENLNDRLYNEKDLKNDLAYNR